MKRLETYLKLQPRLLFSGSGEDDGSWRPSSERAALIHQSLQSKGWIQGSPHSSPSVHTGRQMPGFFVNRLSSLLPWGSTPGCCSPQLLGPMPVNSNIPPPSQHHHKRINYQLQYYPLTLIDQHPHPTSCWFSFCSLHLTGRTLCLNIIKTSPEGTLRNQHAPSALNSSLTQTQILGELRWALNHLQSEGTLSKVSLYLDLVSLMILPMLPVDTLHV